MSTKKSSAQDRQRANRRAQAAMARAQARKRRRVAAAVTAGVLILGIVLAVVVRGGGSKDTDVASNSSTTTAKLAGSVKGKPCVAVKGDLPQGAPEVPVKVGPPPKKLVTEDLKQGDGAVVGATDTLTVNYIGVSCSTGKIFDSSYSRGQPATFPLAQVIPGWQEGIPGMKVGGQRLLGIPPDKAYGGQGRAPDIAPDETLWFVVEVLDAKPA